MEADDDKKPGLNLVGDDYCYACGPANPIGLHLAFSTDPNNYTTSTSFFPTREHQGYQGYLHGGIISTLLDEAMGRLAYDLGIKAVTAELEVRFRLPAAIGEPYTIKGALLSHRSKFWWGKAEMYNKNGKLVAQATGKLVEV